MRALLTNRGTLWGAGKGLHCRSISCFISSYLLFFSALN